TCIEAPGQIERMALTYPVFVKPVAEGSGKGVFASNLCANVAALRERARFLLERYAEPVLVETYLPGPEFTVAILGNGPEAYCLPVIGFDFSALPEGAPPVYGYEAKWVWDRPEAPLAIFQCPARVPAALYREIERTALEAYHALGCRDWCRVDLRVDRFGVPTVLELNPLPDEGGGRARRDRRLVGPGDPEGRRPPRHALVPGGAPGGSRVQPVRRRPREERVGRACRGNARIRRDPHHGREPLDPRCVPPQAHRERVAPASGAPNSPLDGGAGQDRGRLPPAGHRQAGGGGRERGTRPRLRRERP